jgi:hypothetical protein
MIAEVPKSQVGQMHAEKMNCKKSRGEFFRKNQVAAGLVVIPASIWALKNVSSARGSVCDF